LTPPARPGPANISLQFDPVCPFSWITSKWIRTIAAQRDYAVD
jgi:predicted DsbA family dithiol-disulfide isomerase